MMHRIAKHVPLKIDDTNLNRMMALITNSDGEMCQPHRLHLHSGGSIIMIMMHNHNNRWQSQIEQADESPDHVSTFDHGSELQ